MGLYLGDPEAELREGQGHLPSCSQAGRPRRWLPAAVPVPRAPSRNVPRRPVHPSSHPLHPICLGGKVQADSSLSRVGSQHSAICCANQVGSGQVATPHPGLAPKPIQSSTRSPAAPHLGRKWREREVSTESDKAPGKG